MIPERCLVVRQLTIVEPPLPQFASFSDLPSCTYYLNLTPSIGHKPQKAPRCASQHILSTTRVHFVVLTSFDCCGLDQNHCSFDSSCLRQSGLRVNRKTKKSASRTYKSSISPSTMVGPGTTLGTNALFNPQRPSNIPIIT